MKHIYTTIILALLTLAGFAQQPADVTPQAATDADTVSVLAGDSAYIHNPRLYLSKLDSTLFPTGILIDRVVAFRKDIHQFNGDDRVKTCSFYLWKQLYGNLAQACNNTMMMPQYDAIKPYLLGVGRYHNTYILPILNMQFNTIDAVAYQRGDFTATDSFLVSNGATKKSFTTTRLLAATPFAGRIHGNTATFMVDSNLYISNIANEQLQSVEADFDDGSGWQTLQWNVPVTVSYGASSHWVMAKLRLTLMQSKTTIDSIGKNNYNDTIIQRYTHFTFLHTGTDLVPAPNKVTTDTVSKNLLKSDVLDNESGLSENVPPYSLIQHYGSDTIQTKSTTWASYDSVYNYQPTYYAVSMGITIAPFTSNHYWPNTPFYYLYSAQYIGTPHTYSWTDTIGTKFDYNILWGNGNTSGKLRKPMIIVDGFDPGNTRDYYQTLVPNPTGNTKTDDYRGIYELMNGEKSAWSKDTGATLCADLTASGYDLLFINWTDGAGDIPKNAQYLRDFLNDMTEGPNSPKYRDNQTEENILVGPSMGGLITRYCLTTMEQAHEEPHVKLWFSFDSPQQGANIPISLQLSVFALEQKLQQLDNGAASLVENYKLHNGIDALKSGISELTSDAARQMLLYHIGYMMNDNFGYSPSGWLDLGDIFNKYCYGMASAAYNPLLGCDSYKDKLYSALQSLGYPKFSKNVAISNGGTAPLYTNNHSQTVYFLVKGAMPAFSLSGYGNTNSSNTSDSSQIYSGVFEDAGNNFYYDVTLDAKEQIGYDNAAGSYTTALYDFNTNTSNNGSPDMSQDSYSKSTFMVTASTFGIPVTQDNVYKTHDQYVASDTPFDDIYGTSYVVPGVCDGSNEEHVRVSDLTSKWLKNYLEGERQAIQKPYRSDVIETESNKCLYTAVNSVTMGGQNNSSFTIKSGADVQAIAPHIIMQPGFKVEQGAHFVAKPQTVVNGLKDYVEKPDTAAQPKNVVTYLTPSKYDKKVYDYAENNPLPHQGIAVKNNNTIRLYPNPASNEVYIVCTDSNVVSLSVQIINMLGMPVKTNTLTNGQAIDVSALTSGIYFIEVFYNNRQHCFKLIKD